MSMVDNWLLLLEVGEQDGLNEVNACLADVDKCRRQQFNLLDEYSWGGSRCPEVDVFGMAANHLPADNVLAAIKGAKWNEPDQCAVAFCPQKGGWQIWQLNALPETIKGG